MSTILNGEQRQAEDDDKPMVCDNCQGLFDGRASYVPRIGLCCKSCMLEVEAGADDEEDF